MPRTRTAFAFLLPCLFAAAARAAEPVELETADGRTIRGEFHRAGDGRGRSAVLALHMFLGDRGQFAGLAEEFARRGVGFLAIDLRGHGASRGSEADRAAVVARDPQVFGAMRRDVDAAMAWLAKEGYDGGRVGLLGGSLGACLALDLLGRDPSVPCAALLTPLASHPGLDPVASAKKAEGRSVLVFSSREESGRGAEAIWSALPGDDAELRLVDEHAAHGTGLLQKKPSLVTDLAEWFGARLAGGFVLDGVLDPGETRPAEMRPLGESGTLYVRRLPDHVWLGARGADLRALLLTIGGREFAFDAEGVGRSGAVLPLPAGVVRAVGDGTVEVLLRLGSFGLVRGGEVRISARLRSGPGDLSPAHDVRLYYPRSARRRDD